MTTRLKRCPFCGRNAFTQIMEDAWHEEVVQIGCETANCKGCLYYGKYWGDNALGEAVTAWNTRVKK